MLELGGQVGEALLHYITSKLVAGQIDNITLNVGPDTLANLGRIADSKHVLEDIIGKGIVAKAVKLRLDRIEKCLALGLLGNIHGTLDNDAPLLGSGDLVASGSDGVNKEGAIYGVKQELDNAAGVERVGAQAVDQRLIRCNLLDEHLLKLSYRHTLHQSLDDVAAVGVKEQVAEVGE
eukprot:GILK01008256.1.p2 GENE.GILK01008256.1~~GILK01008256.1.p2  ORF type:complete len:178 (-),score=19.36 GILK01008256.1:596-1129(-)